MKTISLLLVLVITLFITTTIATHNNENELSINDYFRDDPYEIHNFTQRVNIYDPLNLATFPQRYYIDKSSYDPKNPIIYFYTGGEAPLEYYWFSSGGTFRAMANKAKALKLFVEHRYYGTSFPYDGKNNSFLSAEHALEDAMRVLLAVIKEVVPENSAFPQVIAAGGSYAGMMASMARARYPHIISAAIASSSPYLMIGQEWKLIPMNYAYFRGVTEDYTRYNPTCTSIVRQAFDIFDHLYQNKNFTVIQQLLNTCQPINNDETYEHAIGWIRSAFIDMAQGNNANNDDNFSFPVRHACDILIKGQSNPFQAIGKVMDYAFQHEIASTQPKFWTKHFSKIQTFLQQHEQLHQKQFTGQFDFSTILPPHFATNKSGFKSRLDKLFHTNDNTNSQCHDIYEEYVECVDTSGCGGDEYWDFQACTQLTYYPSCDCQCMFPGFFHGFQEHTAYCKSKFGTDVGQDHTRLLTSFPTTNWKSVNNVFFTNFLEDPWSKGGILSSQSLTILSAGTNDGSHHYDLNTPTKNDTPDIINFRNFEYDVIMEMAKIGGPDFNKMKEFQIIIDKSFPPPPA